MSKIYDYPCPSEEWQEFIKAMNSGEEVGITHDMFDYWLGVLPPIFMNRYVDLRNGQKVRAIFGFAEGGEVIAFYARGKQIFCCGTGCYPEFFYRHQNAEKE